MICSRNQNPNTLCKQKFGHSQTRLGIGTVLSHHVQRRMLLILPMAYDREKAHSTLLGSMSLTKNTNHNMRFAKSGVAASTKHQFSRKKFPAAFFCAFLRLITLTRLASISRATSSSHSARRPTKEIPIYPEPINSIMLFDIYSQRGKFRFFIMRLGSCSFYLAFGGLR